MFTEATCSLSTYNTLRCMYMAFVLHAYRSFPILPYFVATQRHRSLAMASLSVDINLIVDTVVLLMALYQMYITLVIHLAECPSKVSPLLIYCERSKSGTL